MQFVLGIVFGVVFAVYKDYAPFPPGVMFGVGLLSPLILVMGIGFSALSKEGYTSLNTQSAALFMAAGVPMGAILGSFL